MRIYGGGGFRGRPVLDALTGARIVSINDLAAPHEIVAHRESRLAFVAEAGATFLTHPGQDTVSAVDLGNGVFVKAFAAEGKPDTVVWVPGLQEE